MQARRKFSLMTCASRHIVRHQLWSARQGREWHHLDTQPRAYATECTCKTTCIPAGSLASITPGNAPSISPFYPAFVLIKSTSIIQVIKKLSSRGNLKALGPFTDRTMLQRGHNILGHILILIPARLACAPQCVGRCAGLLRPFDATKTRSRPPLLYAHL